MSATDHQKLAKKRTAIFLALTLGTSFFCGLLAAWLPDDTGKAVYQSLQKGFTAVPVLSALLTRCLTKDRSGWNLSLRVWKYKRILLFSAFLPGAAVLLGAGLYYIVFPQEFYANVQGLLTFCAQYGLPADIRLSPGTTAAMVLILWLASALAIPIHLLELGEEIGWRGYLLPQLLSFMSNRKAVWVNGLLWGLMHTPLIYFGFNYGTDYWGAPYTGILMMLLVCVGMGIWMSYTMIKTNNCMYAAIIHGAFNVACDMQILSVVTNRPLLGPAPTGIVGLSVILAVSIVLFQKLTPVKEVVYAP